MYIYEPALLDGFRAVFLVYPMMFLGLPRCYTLIVIMATTPYRSGNISFPTHRHFMVICPQPQVNVFFLAKWMVVMRDANEDMGFVDEKVDSLGESCVGHQRPRIKH